MKAIAVFPGEKAVRLVDHPEPGIESPTQVKLRMLEVGVCGTDHEIVTFQYGTPPPGEDHLVIGHESLGEVREVGGQVTRLRPGDLAVVTVRRPCPHEECLPCRSGRQDFCTTGDYTERGIKGRHGFMTEWVVEEEQYLHPVPRDRRDFAVLTEPLTIAEKSMIQVWEIQARLPWACRITPDEKGQPEGTCHRAVVLGAGPVGLLGAMLIRKYGFETYVYSREGTDSRRAQVAAGIGAHYVSAQDADLDKLVKIAGNVDLVYEATGASKLAFDFLPHLGVNAVFVFTGVPGRRSPVTVPADRIMRDMVLKNQIIFGSVNAGPPAFDAAVRDLGEFHTRWPDALRAVITQRVGIDDYQSVLLKPEAGIKRVIKL